MFDTKAREVKDHIFNVVCLVSSYHCGFVSGEGEFVVSHNRRGAKV